MARAKTGASSFFRGLCRILASLLFLALLLFALGAGILVYLNTPPSLPQVVQSDTLRVESDGTLLIEIRSGESEASVGFRLEQAGLIKSRLFWNLMARFSARSGGDFLKSGIYRFHFPASQIEIRRMLVSGREVLTKVTIPEGLTLKKTADILEKDGICAASDFIKAASDGAILLSYGIPGKTMEGYLFPDTYQFPRNCPADRVVRTMGDTFFRRLRSIDKDAPSMAASDLNERVILASIVEREYQARDEAPLMAGVFDNRLAIDMALQSCATVEYVITEIQGKPHPTVLHGEDIAIKNPYNTYTRKGLPPGPICSPGEVALNAAFHPQRSDYLYFRLVNPQEGRHYFSKTLDSHIKAGALYLKAVSSR